MAVTGSATAGRRRKLIGLVAVVAGLVGGVAVPAFAVGTGGSSLADVQPAAAPPEVWEAWDNERVVARSSTTRFAFTVPAGSYAISAKLDVLPGSGLPAVDCRLSAGGNFDRSGALVGIAQGNPPLLFPRESVALAVAHRSPSAGSIVLECGANAGGSATLSFVKIHATRVNALTQIGL